MKFASAAGAYATALKRAIAPGAGAAGGAAETKAAGGGFAEMLGGAANQALETLRAGEKTALKGAVKQAELIDVVTAVSSAEMALQTVVTIRDQAVQAYQEILRMPI